LAALAEVLVVARHLDPRDAQPGGDLSQQRGPGQELLPDVRSRGLPVEGLEVDAGALLLRARGRVPDVDVPAVAEGVARRQGEPVRGDLVGRLVVRAARG